MFSQNMCEELTLYSTGDGINYKQQTSLGPLTGPDQFNY